MTAIHDLHLKGTGVCKIIWKISVCSCMPELSSLPGDNRPIYNEQRNENMNLVEIMVRIAAIYNALASDPTSCKVVVHRLMPINELIYDLFFSKYLQDQSWSCFFLLFFHSRSTLYQIKIWVCFSISSLLIPRGSGHSCPVPGCYATTSD